MLKRALFLLTFLFLFSVCYAGSHNHFQAGASFMPALMLDESFDYDIFKLSYAPGLQMYYGGKKFYFNTGIHYLHLVEQHDFIKHKRERDTDYVNGYDSTIYESKSSRRYHLFGIPLMGSLILGESKTKFNLEAGLQINYLIATGGKTIFHYKDGSESTSTSLSSINPREVDIFFAPTLRVGIQRSLSKHFIIKVMPEISWQLSTQGQECWVAGIQFIALKSFQ